MDFDLSDDQLALRDAARGLLDDLASPARVRKVVDAGTGTDPDLWRAVVDQGWLAVEVAEAAGGLGLGTVEVAVLMEEVGGHLAPIPFAETLLALGALADAAAAGVDRAGPWLERLVAGEAVGCVAADGVTLEAVGGGSGGREEVDAGGSPATLRGRTGPVIAAPLADVAVVVAHEGEGTDPPDAGGPGPAGLYLVDLADRRPAAEPAMDRTRQLGWLDLEGAPAVRLGGAAAVDRLVDRGATLASAELLGASERMLAMTVDYAKERQQFGRPIGSFQAVKHRCADMLVDVEGMRSAAYYAAWCVSVSHADASVAASTAKVWCSDAATRVMSSGLQVHGGIGFTWEHDVHLFLKRAHLTGLSFGDAGHHRRRLAALLRPRVEAGESVV